MDWTRWSRPAPTIGKISVIGGGARSRGGAGCSRRRSSGRSSTATAAKSGPAFGAARLARLAETGRTGRRMSARRRRCAPSSNPTPAMSSDWRRSAELFPALSGPSSQDSEERDHAERATVHEPASYFGGDSPHPLRRPRSRTTRWPSATTTRTAWSSASAWKTCLRPAVCYWHSFCWDGHDIFGAGTFDRPWHAGADDPRGRVRQDGRGVRLLHHGSARRSTASTTST